MSETRCRSSHPGAPDSERGRHVDAGQPRAGRGFGRQFSSSPSFWRASIPPRTRFNSPVPGTQASYWMLLAGSKRCSRPMLRHSESMKTAPINARRRFFWRRRSRFFYTPTESSNVSTIRARGMEERGFSIPLPRSYQEGAEELINGLIDAVQLFSRMGSERDDMTCVLVKSASPVTVRAERPPKEQVDAADPYKHFHLERKGATVVLHLQDANILSSQICQELQTELLRVVSQEKPQHLFISFRTVHRLSSETINALLRAREALVSAKRHAQALRSKARNSPGFHLPEPRWDPVRVLRDGGRCDQHNIGLCSRQRPLGNQRRVSERH